LKSSASKASRRSTRRTRAYRPDPWRRPAGPTPRRRLRPTDYSFADVARGRRQPPLTTARSDSARPYAPSACPRCDARSSSRPRSMSSVVRRCARPSGAPGQ
jgi:hypothetical protein